jgi:hypothetical protein
MNIYERFIQWRDSRRLRRLEADLNTLNNKKAIYNPNYAAQLIVGYNPEIEFTRRIAEYYTWFVGNGRRLNLFYKTSPELSENLSYFWREAPPSYRKVHSGLPSLIARKMGIVLFGGGLDTTIEVLDENGKVNEDLSAAIKEELTKLQQQTDIEIKLSEAATTESWGGHVFFKLSCDTELTKCPILEIVDVRNALAIKERGITTAIEFYNYYEKGQSKYVHKEIYSTDENGWATISNELWCKSATGEKQEPLTLLPQTANLPEVVIFEGLNGMLAFEKANKLPNAEFYESGYGESDFAGAVSAFDALDETLSEIFKEIRDNKTIRYIPQTMLMNIENAEGESLMRYDSFITNYQKINDQLTEQTKHEINITQIADKTAQHLEKWKVALTVAVNKAGLSPLALGVTGLEAVNAGMESQRERNKATLETRSLKIKLWQPVIERLYKQLLAFNAWLIKTGGGEGETSMPDDINNVRLTVKFGDYIADSISERITTWGSAKTQRVASTEEAIREIHPDWSETQVENEVNIIRYENGIEADTPESLPGLTGIEEVLME